MPFPHGGGSRFDTDSQEYGTILNWVRNGAPFEPEGGVAVPRIEEVAVYPEELVLDGEGVHRLAVTARLSDGRTRDISDEVRYESQNRAVAKVDADGVVTAVKTGETNVLVRAAGHTVHARIGVIAEPIADYPDVPEWNFIDRHVIAKLKRFHLIPSELSDDSDFLRRVCLDVIGTLPPPNRVREFLEDDDPDKRNKLIEILLDSPEYVDFWTLRFSDLLRVVQDPSYSQLYWEWIRTSIASNKPYDQMARERLDAQGRDRPSRHYFENNSQPERILSEELRVYTGRRFDCAQCHDHPFEPWSQDQFWGLAAFFGNLDFIGYYDIAFDNPAGGYGDKGQAGPLKHPRKQTVVQPAFLDGTTLPEELRPNQRRGAGQVAHCSSLLCRSHRQSGLGILFRERDRRSGGRFQGLQSTDSPGAAQGPGRRLPGERTRPQAPGSADRAIQDLSAVEPTEPEQPRRPDQLLPFLAEAPGSGGATGRHLPSERYPRSLSRETGVA